MSSYVVKHLGFVNVNSIDEDNYKVTVIVSDDSVDRNNEIVDQKGWDLSSYSKHSVLLADHKHSSIEHQIGEAKVDIADNKLIAEFTYYVNKGNELADWAWFLVKQKKAAYSVGFVSKEVDFIDTKEGRKLLHKQMELVEISQVVIPANTNAVLNGLQSEDIVVKSIAETINDKLNSTTGYLNIESVSGSTSYGIIEDMATAWDGSKAKREILEYAGGADNVNWTKYGSCFMWTDTANKEVLGGYKLPFVYVENSTPKVVFKALSAIVGALNGSRGGLDVSEADRRSIYNKVKTYYNKFKQEIPELKDYEIEEIKDRLNRLENEILNNKEVKMEQEETPKPEEIPKPEETEKEITLQTLYDKLESVHSLLKKIVEDKPEDKPADPNTEPPIVIENSGESDEVILKQLADLYFKNN